MNYEVIIIKIEAEYITQKGAYYGELKVSHNYVTFESSDTKRPSDEIKYVFGSLNYNLLSKKKKK